MPFNQPSPAIYSLPRDQFDDLRRNVIAYLRGMGWGRCALGYSMDIEVDIVPHGYTLGFRIGAVSGCDLAAALGPDGRPVTDGRVRKLLADYRPVPMTASSDMAEGLPRALAARIAVTAVLFHARMCRPAISGTDT